MGTPTGAAFLFYILYMYKNFTLRHNMRTGLKNLKKIRKIAKKSLIFGARYAIILRYAV